MREEQIMCFVLHIATDSVLARSIWDEHDRHVWVGEVDQYAESVKQHFSGRHVAYVGSDLNCGCGFRNISFQGGGWPEQWLVDEGKMDIEGSDKNHRELHTLLLRALRDSEPVELYGCWDDDYAEKTEQEQDLDLDAILSERFFFRARVLYRIKRTAQRPI